MKLSSYQKLKQKYEKDYQELIDDIITLVEKGDDEEGILLKAEWMMKIAIEKAVMDCGDKHPEDRKSKYVCELCGRNIFDKPSPHKCKRGLTWHTT